MELSLNGIKTKISSTRKTRHITNAMQMISATKLNKSSQATADFQLYTLKVRQLLTDLLHAERINGSRHPMIVCRPVKKVGYVVITSDKGLVGSYNSELLKEVMSVIAENHVTKTGGDFCIVSIGNIGCDFFHAQGIDPIYEFRGLSDYFNFDEASDIVTKTVEMYKNEVFDELYVCYNHHINSLTRQVILEQLLPIIDLDWNEAKGYTATFDLEPDRDSVLDQLLPQYVESTIYGAILDSKTSENAAGMMAMQTATDNAEKIINDLTVQYNCARQSSITQEIIEIVAGVSALE